MWDPFGSSSRRAACLCRRSDNDRRTAGGRIVKPSLQRRRPPGGPFDYSIRPLQPADLEGISRVHWRACSTAYQFMNWSYTEDEVRCWYAGKLGEWDWGRVACAGDTVIAFLAAIGAHIDQLFVDPDHQRVGAMLERRLRPATLQVFAQNTRARVFYERFGFRQVDA
jgi:GNAT superfamily N-acetyltransferase